MSGTRYNIIRTIAGTGQYGFSGDGGLATSAKFANQGGIAKDSSGNLYIADTGNCRIRKIDSSGIITTIAGTTTAGYSGDGGAATSATLFIPSGIAVDSANNIYIADSTNQVIRKIDSSGIITTIAGTGAGGFFGDGGLATSAKLFNPEGVLVDSIGNIYIADTDNGRIRKIDSSGIINTIAGNGTVGGMISGIYKHTNAIAISSPIGVVKSGIALDSSGNLYIGEWGFGFIHKMDSSGIINTIAGTGTVVDPSGDGGPAINAVLSAPYSLAVDSGNVYICDEGSSIISLIDSSGILHYLARNGFTGTSGYGDGGPALSANLFMPRSIIVSSGIVYVSDSGNKRIRTFGGVIPSSVVNVTGSNISPTGFRVSYSGGVGSGATLSATAVNGGTTITSTNVASGYITFTGLTPSTTYTVVVSSMTVGGGASSAPITVTTSAAPPYTPVWQIDTIAGTGLSGNSGDNEAATSATFTTPRGIVVDSSSNIYIADIYKVRKIDSSGIIRTVAGTGVGGYSGDDSAATDAKLALIHSIATDSSNNLYIADAGNSRIRKVDSSGIITTIAGTGVAGYSGDGFPATSAELYAPYGVAVDSVGNIYIADAGSFVIRKIDISGIITTIAGDGTDGNSTGPNIYTNALATSSLGETRSLTVDSSGNVYIIDYAYNIISKIDSSGIINTIAGTGEQVSASGGGGPAINAIFSAVTGITVNSGYIYLSDKDDSRISVIDPYGILHYIGGDGTFGYDGDGGPALNAKFNGIGGMTMSSGALYISDGTRIRVLGTAPTPIENVVAYNITSTGFNVSYTGGIGAGVTFSATARNPLGMRRLALGITITSISATSTTAVFTGLSPSTTYTVIVTATGTYGSVTSTPISVTTRRAICFLRGSKILCLNEDVQEYLPIEKLKVGTLVKTLDGSFKPIHTIGKSIFNNPDNAERGPNRLFKLTPANYPSLKEDLIVTGCHSLLVDKIEPKYKEKHIKLMKELYVTSGKYRLMAFIDEKAEPYISPGDQEIWHLALEHENTACNYGIYANGLLVETASIDTMRETGGLVLIP